MSFIELAYHIKHFRNKKINIIMMILSVIVLLILYITNLGSSLYVERDISALNILNMITAVVINYVVLMLWSYTAYDLWQYLKKKNINYRLTQIEKAGIFLLVISYPTFILQGTFLFSSVLVGLIGICNLIIGIIHYRYCSNLLSASFILNGLAIFCSGYLLTIEGGILNL